MTRKQRFIITLVAGMSIVGFYLCSAAWATGGSHGWTYKARQKMLKKIEREIRFTWKSYYRSDFVKKGQFYEFLIPKKKCGFNADLDSLYTAYTAENLDCENNYGGGPAYEWPESLFYTPIAMMGLATIMNDDKLFRQAYDIVAEGFYVRYGGAFSNLTKKVNVFEVIIRVLGGLLAVYEMRLDIEGPNSYRTSTLLEMAQDFADTLKPAIFRDGDLTPDDRPICSGMTLDGDPRGLGCPENSWDMNPAVLGSNYLEFVKLNQLSQETPFWYLKTKKYEDWEKRAYNILVGIYDGRKDNDLIGYDLDYKAEGWPDGNRYHTSGYAGVYGGIDSYLEYVKKGILVTSKPERREKLRTMWKTLSRGLIEHTTAKAYDVEAGKKRIWIQQVNVDDTEDTLPKYGALEAFFPGTLALRVDGVPIFLQLAHRQLAKALHRSWDAVWNKYGLEPDQYYFCQQENIVGPGIYKNCTGSLDPTKPPEEGVSHYYLRPEIIESAYYLHHYTRDPRYLDQIAQYFEDIIDFCKVDGGYNMVHNVGPEMRDNPDHRTTIMESYFIAESLKYIYLAFADPDDLPFEFEDVVFNTEAHPLRRLGLQE